MGSINKFQQSEEVTESDFPNGFAGYVPAPFFPVYPGPYSFRAYQDTYSEDLINLTWGGVAYIPVSSGTHTYDGYTLPLFGPVQTYVVAVTVPPWQMTDQAYGQMTNFWFADNLYTYTMRFVGEITYYCG
jgi:hypothetical protein